MTLQEAEKVRSLKKRCTYRALAEKWYPQKHNLHGNQMAGQDLCRDACKLLGIDWMRGYVPGEDPEFDRLNLSEFSSMIGSSDQYYWWE